MKVSGVLLTGLLVTTLLSAPIAFAADKTHTKSVPAAAAPSAERKSPHQSTCAYGCKASKDVDCVKKCEEAHAKKDEGKKETHAKATTSSKSVAKNEGAPTLPKS